MRWSGLGDDQILRLAAAQFDALITVDQSLEYQQSASTRIAIVTLISRSIEIQSLRPLIPGVLSALAAIRPGERIRISQEPPD